MNWEGVNGLINGAPDENTRGETRRRWNVVKSAAGTSRIDNLTETYERGSGSRGELEPLELR